jgi:hypothetical protein
MNIHLPPGQGHTFTASKHSDNQTHAREKAKARDTMKPGFPLDIAE